MKHNAKRFLSLLLALVMVIGLMPMSHAHAEGETFHTIVEKVTEVEADAVYVICIAGTKNALSNQQGSGAWGTHTLATGACDKIADERILWTLESAEGGYKIKNVNGYLNISRNSASLNETGHIFELVYHEDGGWAIKSLETNEYGNNLGDSGSIGGWSGDGTKFDLYSVVEVAAEEIDPFGKLRGFWSKVSVDTETSYDWKEGLFEYAFDSNPATIWHSNWQGASDKLNGSNTFAGVIDFGAVYTINQFSFTPRVGNASGQVTQASLYVRETDEAEWILVVEHATFEANGDKKDMDFDAQPVRFVKFVAEQSNDGWVAVSEFDVAYNAPVHEHTYEAVVTAPTCTEGGYTTYTCACGDTYIADETEALGHNDGPIVVENEKPSTCTEGGYYDAVCYCTVCGVETYRSHIVVGPDGHYPTVFPGHPATCTKPGLTDGKRCGVCLEWIEPQEEIPALGHTPVSIPGYPATCTEDGMTDGSYCSVCDETITAQEVIPATGHAFGEWTETKAPTCTEDGEQSRSCANCQETETEVIAKLGHSYEAVVTAPTCTEGGYTTYTCACGDTYTADETEALGHTPVALPGCEATCTADGLTEGSYCSVCDETIVAQEVIPATGHAFGEWTETKAPTCTEDGEQSRSCANCDAVETEAIELLGHEHELTEEVAPTCTEDGYSVYTCVACGDSYVADETEALGHSYENGSCVRCGETDPNAVTEIANGWSGYTTWVLTSDGTLTVSPTEQLFNGKCNMANYHKINGVLTLPWSAYAEQITKVVIEEGVNAVGQMAFYELPNLREVVLADSVEEIRNYAFKNTTSLTTINLEVVEFIREGAFYGCSALENLTFAEGVVIEGFAFSKTPYASLNP